MPDALPGTRRRARIYRVSYEVDDDASKVVVLAIGVKDRNRLIIGGEEYES